MWTFLNLLFFTNTLTPVCSTCSFYLMFNLKNYNTIKCIFFYFHNTVCVCIKEEEKCLTVPPFTETNNESINFTCFSIKFEESNNLIITKKEWVLGSLNFEELTFWVSAVGPIHNFTFWWSCVVHVYRSRVSVNPLVAFTKAFLPLYWPMHWLEHTIAPCLLWSNVFVPHSSATCQVTFIVEWR